MKIASYIQDGKRWDIIIPEVRGQLNALPFSKGGPGSGIYDRGPSKAKDKEGEAKAKQGAMDIMRDTGMDAARDNLERTRAAEKGLAEGPGGLEIGDIVSANISENGIPEFEGRIIGKEGDNYILENEKGYQEIYPKDKIVSDDASDDWSAAAHLGVRAEYGRIDKEPMMDRRLRIEEDVANLSAGQLKAYTEEIVKPGICHEEALANVTQSDANPNDEDRGL